MSVINPGITIAAKEELYAAPLTDMAMYSGWESYFICSHFTVRDIFSIMDKEKLDRINEDPYGWACDENITEVSKHLRAYLNKALQARSGNAENDIFSHAVKQAIENADYYEIVKSWLTKISIIENMG